MGICAGSGVSRLVVGRDLQDQIVLSECMEVLVQLHPSRFQQWHAVFRTEFDGIAVRDRSAGWPCKTPVRNTRRK
jgi:hypothetical protein